MNNTAIAPAENLVGEFEEFLSDKAFPCVAARAAKDKKQIKYYVAAHMACPHDDKGIFDFLGKFIDDYRAAGTQFHSACVIFQGPLPVTGEMFDQLLWMRLQALSNLDAAENDYDERVSLDPGSQDFSFSIKKEAFFVVGLNPGSSRDARNFKYPVLVFNPHAQFETLRATGSYEKMKTIVRKRDMSFSGSINPTLEDFGKSSEVFQYSGVKHDSNWVCPLKTQLYKNNRDTAA